MDCCEVYLGVFGDWRWERVSEGGVLIEESLGPFEEFADCVEDARLHGYCVKQVGQPHELLVPA